MTFSERRCELANISKTWKNVALTLPLRRLTIPRLPTSVHIEICANVVAMEREVYLVSQELWVLPLEIRQSLISPYRMLRNRACEQKGGEWSVAPNKDEVGTTWRTAVKLSDGLIEFSGLSTDDYPHYCEIKDVANRTFRGYISEDILQDLLCPIKNKGSCGSESAKNKSLENMPNVVMAS